MKLVEVIKTFTTSDFTNVATESQSSTNAGPSVTSTIVGLRLTTTSTIDERLTSAISSGVRLLKYMVDVQLVLCYTEHNSIRY